jgi:hypothetical protein
MRNQVIKVKAGRKDKIMDLEWHDLDSKGGDNDVSVAFALGYMLRVTARSSGGYKTEAVSVGGNESIGYCGERDAAQMQLEGWLKQKAKEWAR